MDPRLTRGEYWLLEAVVDHSVPLCFLDPATYDRRDGIEEMFNKPGHGLDRSLLIEVLTRLLRNDWVEAELLGNVLALDSQQLVGTLDELRPRFSTKPCTYYRLTEQGGAVWEAFAAPQWHKYLKEESDLEAREGCVTSATVWRVEKYMRYLELLGDRLITSSIQFEIIAPWQVTYWKELPQGMQARFSWNGDHDLHVGDESYRLLLSDFSRFCGEWYAWR